MSLPRPPRSTVPAATMIEKHNTDVTNVPILCSAAPNWPPAFAPSLPDAVCHTRMYGVSNDPNSATIADMYGKLAYIRGTTVFTATSLVGGLANTEATTYTKSGNDMNASACVIFW